MTERSHQEWPNERSSKMTKRKLIKRKIIREDQTRGHRRGPTGRSSDTLTGWKSLALRMRQCDQIVAERGRRQLAYRHGSGWWGCVAPPHRADSCRCPAPAESAVSAPPCAQTLVPAWWRHSWRCRWWRWASDVGWSGSRPENQSAAPNARLTYLTNGGMKDLPSSELAGVLIIYVNQCNIVILFKYWNTEKFCHVSLLIWWSFQWTSLRMHLIFNSVY